MFWLYTEISKEISTEPGCSNVTNSLQELWLCEYCSLAYHQSVVVTNDCYSFEVSKHKGYRNAVFWPIISGYLSVHAQTSLVLIFLMIT